MSRSTTPLRDDLFAIWRAGVAAVDSARLVREHLRVNGDWLEVGDESVSLADIRRIVVVGAGKAGAGMASGFESALGDELLREKKTTGWINVPEDCVRTLRHIHLHGARPAGVNEPTAEGVAGTEQILKLVGELDPHDLCVCLISGGGSALLPAPVAAVGLANKQAITKHLSSAGANIQELNTVRKQLSRVKGGGLARACRASRLFTLIISDVLGDPLDVIASGPTVTDSTTPSEALRILNKYGARQAGIERAVFDHLEQAVARNELRPVPSCAVSNCVIGNNATAVDAAGIEAERRGYSHAMHAATQLESEADGIGQHHAAMALQMRDTPGPDCLITGGEPTVKLVDAARRGLGGRNQQLVLAAVQKVLVQRDNFDRIAMLSAGTDGEDGPTDAAGAFFDAELFAAMMRRQLAPKEFLERNDAYHFFEPLGGLLRTGPTHTNVCDLRVIVVDASR